MDSRPKSPARVAYSFAAGTFDLRAWCPGLWYEGDDGRSTAVWLDGRWERLIEALRGLGGMLASARSGPVCLASAWQQADFQQIPGTHEFVELNSGVELRRHVLGAVTAVVEEAAGQQMASLQFFHRNGQGCLKLMLTDASQLDAFKDLVQTHAAVRPWNSTGVTAEVEAAPRPAWLPAAEQVAKLWPGLSRSHPGRHFPGLAMMPRLAALKAVGEAYAWRLQPAVERRAMELMVERAAAIRVLLRNQALFIGADCRFMRHSVCGCGQTFFSEQGQLTLRRCCGEWTAWGLDMQNPRQQDWRIELYDQRGQFCTQLGLAETASQEHRQAWAQALLEGQLR